MSKKEVVGSMSGWSGVLKDMFRQFDDGSLGLNHVRAFVEHRNPFSVDLVTLIADWHDFYCSIGIVADFSNLRISVQPAGFDRLLVIAKGITPQVGYGKCAELFSCWKGTNESLDEVIDFSFQARTAKKGAYAIWVRDRIEADEELKNTSANALKSQNIAGITLEERFIYELKYFKETKKHLDVRSVTLCTGSRYDDGSVPSVYWGDGRMCVYWYNPVSAYVHLRSRQAVS